MSPRSSLRPRRLGRRRGPCFFLDSFENAFRAGTTDDFTIAFVEEIDHVLKAFLSEGQVKIVLAGSLA